MRKHLEFEYTNWRGVAHIYVVEPESMEIARAGDLRGSWVLHGQVVTRDGDPRSDMRNSRRRTFKLSGMRNIREVKPELTLGGAKIAFEAFLDRMDFLGYMMKFSL